VGEQERAKEQERLGSRNGPPPRIHTGLLTHRDKDEIRGVPKLHAETKHPKWVLHADAVDC
jgi:hypothetical protein